MDIDQLKELMTAGTIIKCHQTISSDGQENPVETKNEVLIVSTDEQGLVLKTLVSYDGTKTNSIETQVPWSSMQLQRLNPPFFMFHYRKPFVVTLQRKEG